MSEHAQAGSAGPHPAAPRRTFLETMRRAQIIGCAIEVLAELGVDWALFAEIAERAGVSSAVLARTFADREDLIAQVVDEVYARGQEFVGPLVADAPTAAGKLRAFILGSVAFYEAYPMHIAALARIRERPDTGGPHRRPEGSERLPDARAVELAALEALLHRGRREGDFRDCDVSVVASTISKALDGAVAHVLAEGSGKAYAEELAALFDRGLRA